MGRIIKLGIKVGDIWSAEHTEMTELEFEFQIIQKIKFKRKSYYVGIKVGIDKLDSMYDVAIFNESGDQVNHDKGDGYYSFTGQLITKRKYYLA